MFKFHLHPKEKSFYLIIYFLKEAFVICTNRESQVSVNNRLAAWGVEAVLHLDGNERAWGKRERSAFYKVLVSREAAPLHNHKSPRWKYGVCHIPTSWGGFWKGKMGLAALVTARLQGSFWNFRRYLLVFIGCFVMGEGSSTMSGL